MSIALFMRRRHSRGFTLIELLVVIAIIGILSSVVLASLNSARTKARDATVLQNMDAISPQAIVYQDANGTFGTSVNDCSVALFSDATFQNVFSSVAALNNDAEKVCYANDTSFAVALARPSGSGFTPATVYWCVESTGKKCGIDDVAVLANTGLCGCP